MPTYRCVLVAAYGLGPYINGYKYVIKDTQSSGGLSGLSIKVFTVRNTSTGCDMYKSLDEIIQLITANDYDFTHTR